MKKKEIIIEPVEIEKPEPKKGLTRMQVLTRQEAGLTNAAPENAGKTSKEIILSHCFTFFNMVFLVLMIVLLACGSDIFKLDFMVIVLINTVIGIIQEIRAKKAVEKLNLVAAGTVRTVRDGQVQQVPTAELVRDDIVEFRAGDQICADGVLVSGNLQVNESLITGEADAIKKKVEDEVKSGSFVVSGTARVRLTHVGGESFAAKLAAEAKANPQAKKSGMAKSMDGLIRFIGIALIPVGVALFYQQYAVQKIGLTESANGTVAALVGMIPEGLYLLTSMALAASAVKLSRQKVLVRDMNCIETLARVDVLCVDKTGTITEPKMEVEQVIPLSSHDPQELEDMLSAFYDHTEPENDTAQAMTEMFSHNVGWKCTRRIPFSSQTKWSAAEFSRQGTVIVGAPEFIMGDRFEEVEEDVEEWTSLGYRVLLVAEYDGYPESWKLKESLLTPVALVTLTNRVRPEAPDTFKFFTQKGVTIKVISGDNPATVSDVARRANIPGAEDYIDVSVLESDRDFRIAVENYTVFGRVTPDKKKKLVQALKHNKHVVAMTGDGVNDVLAMKESDCGIAMASGAQAASQVAQLVLLNNDFASLPGIVDEGRRVINNIQRAAALFLVKNIFSFFTSMITIFFTLPYPLVTSQLTVISLATIGIPSFFLALQPNYDPVPKRFMMGAMRRAFPGGLTNIFVVVTAMAFMVTFDLPRAEISTIAAAILSVVGILVLYQTCKPLDIWRRIIVGAMAVLLIVCFTTLQGTFSLHLQTGAGKLLALTLLIMTPTVFTFFQRIFDAGDWLSGKFRKRKQEQNQKASV
jgi:cation-transporting ATPase E